jgi:hypothetical protein
MFFFFRSMDSSVARVIAYFGELSSMDSENAIEDHLLITPKLDQTILAHPEVQALLARGLASPSVAIRSFCLTKALSKLVPTEFSDALWLSVVKLIRDEDVGVSQRAIALAALHAKPVRLNVPVESLESLLVESALGELRVLEFVVRSLSLHEELVSVPFVVRVLDRLFVLAVGDGIDVLTAFSALELISGNLVGCKWGQNICLNAKLIERASTKAETAESSVAPALLRFVGMLVAACGDRGLESVQSGKALQLALAALDDPARIGEIYLDGCLCVVEGVAKSCDAGRRWLCENKLLASVVDHVRSGDNYVRVRCSHCVADVLATLEFSNSSETKEEVAKTIEETGQNVLVARLLHLASQPLLTEQRLAVFKLLTMLIKFMPNYAFKSCPTLFQFVTNRAGDSEKDAIEWRFVMVQEAFAHKDTFSAGQVTILRNYLQQGAFYKESRAEVKSEAN